MPLNLKKKKTAVADKPPKKPFTLSALVSFFKPRRTGRAVRQGRGLDQIGSGECANDEKGAYPFYPVGASMQNNGGSANECHYSPRTDTSAPHQLPPLLHTRFNYPTPLQVTPGSNRRLPTSPLSLSTSDALPDDFSGNYPPSPSVLGSAAATLNMLGAMPNSNMLYAEQFVSMAAAPQYHATLKHQPKRRFKSLHISTGQVNSSGSRSRRSKSQHERSIHRSQQKLPSEEPASSDPGSSVVGSSPILKSTTLTQLESTGSLLGAHHAASVGDKAALQPCDIPSVDEIRRILSTKQEYGLLVTAPLAIDTLAESTLSSSSSTSPPPLTSSRPINRSKSNHSRHRHSSLTGTSGRLQRSQSLFETKPSFSFQADMSGSFRSDSRPNRANSTTPFIDRRSSVHKAKAAAMYYPTPEHGFAKSSS